MTSLKCWNSGVASNSSAFILSPLGYGVSFRVPAVSEEEAASSVLLVLAGQLLVGNPASDNLLHDRGEALRVRKAPSVVTKSLFIDVAEQVERLYADVRSVQAALQETPEVLHSVRVDVPIHIHSHTNRVVDDRVLKITLQGFV